MSAPDPERYLSALRLRVAALEGELLSRTYFNDMTLLRFRCKVGHEFQLAPGKVKQGRWCQKCSDERARARRKAPTIAKLCQAVQARGGTILSPRYVNSQTHLCFRCQHGHVWDAVPSSILMGTWCPSCAVVKRRESTEPRRQAVIDRLEHIAAIRGGSRVGDYRNYLEAVKFECGSGHSFERLPDSVESGLWCPECAGQSILVELHAMAQRIGGACLATTYLGSHHALEWKCRVGHTFSVEPEAVRSGRWCPHCRSEAAGSLEKMQQLAAERGGKCLASEYLGAEVKLRWKCDQGHEWEQNPTTIGRGVWCRTCERGYGKSRARLTIVLMHEIASERGGQCLSSRYQGIYDVLRWRCARGHVWSTSANNVRRGGWCPPFSARA